MIIFLTAAMIIAADQISKYYIQSHMLPGTSAPIIQDFFHITYVLNPGAAFGMLENKTLFFIFVAIVLVLAVLYFYPKIPHKCSLLRLGIGLLTGGAIGNVIDRIHSGYVIDFFDFRIWPVFNIADIAIVCGVGIIIYTVVCLSPKEAEANDC
ncbi:MAG: signal peptidase II [Veillonellales bacterium]